MPVLKRAPALAFRLGFGLVLLGATSVPLTVEASESHASEGWSFRVDAPTLSGYLNEWAATQSRVDTPLGTTRLEELSAKFSADEIAIHGVAQAGPFRVPVDVAARATVDEHRVVVLLSGARVNGVNVPDVVLRRLEQQAQAVLDQSMTASRAAVHSVVIAERSLEVSGTYR